MKRPAELYEPSFRSMTRRIEPYDYPAHHLVRRVSRDGTIRVLGKQVFVSSTLQEDEVGLEEVDDGVYDLYFCFYQIGRYHLQDNRIEDIVSRVPVTRRPDRPGRGECYRCRENKVLPMSRECTQRLHNNSPDCLKSRACGDRSRRACADSR